MMADPQSAAPQSVHDLGILLVEDDSTTRTAVSRMLYDLAVRGVWEARDGVHALELLRQHGERINLVICDLEMPRMGGLDLLHALRTSGGSPLTDLPVIVLTAHREAETVKRAIAYGISGYLVKPVNKADLTKRLGFAVQKGR
ncbi:response regulator [Azospirillum sp.]|uniref:response regulator n=1 Tax=Azospirillum sp. TaxID=34012 RepID=UPI003D7334D5